MKHKSGPKPLPRIPYHCPICGTIKMLLPSRIKGQANVYCSRPCRDIGHKKHGETHNGVLSPEYKIWRSIKDRSFNTNNAQFQHYGGRGITLYPGWLDDFPAFLAEIGRRPSPDLTLERIDNAQGYIPGNLRWATRKEQANNTRRNVLLTFNGITQPMAAWLEDPSVIALGITRAIISKRLAHNWTHTNILTTPREC